MSWFFYTGSRPTAVQVGPNKSVSVKPYSYIEVASANYSVTLLLNRGLLSPVSGPPDGAPSVPLHAVVGAKAPKNEDTKFSASFREIGVVAGPSDPKLMVSQSDVSASIRRLHEAGELEGSKKGKRGVMGLSAKMKSKKEAPVVDSSGVKTKGEAGLDENEG